MESFLDLIRCQLKVSKRISNHSNEVLDLINSSTIPTTPKQHIPLPSQQSSSTNQVINGRFALSYYYQKHMNTKQFNIACDALIDNIKAYRNYNTLLEQQFDTIMQDLFQVSEIQQQQHTRASQDANQEMNSMTFLEMNDLRIKFQILELEWLTKQQSQASSGASESQQPIDLMFAHHPSFVESPFAYAEPHLSVSKYRTYFNNSSSSKKSSDTSYSASCSNPTTQPQLLQESEPALSLTGGKRKLNNSEPREQSIRHIEKQLKSTEESIFKHIISTPALMKLESQFEEPIKSKFELADQTVKKRCIEILNSFVPDSIPIVLGTPVQPPHIPQPEKSTTLFRISQTTPHDLIAKSTSPIILEQLQQQQQHYTPQKNQISQLFHSTIATKVIPQSTKSTNLLMPLEIASYNQQLPNNKLTQLITPLKEFIEIESQTDIEQLGNPIQNKSLNVQIDSNDPQKQIWLPIEVSKNTMLTSTPQSDDLSSIQFIDSAINIPLHPVIQEEATTPKETNSDLQQINVLSTQNESASKDMRIQINPCLTNEMQNSIIPISIASVESQVGCVNLKIEETKEVTQVVPLVLPQIITPTVQPDERKNEDIEPLTQTSHQYSRKQHQMIPQKKLDKLQKSKKDNDETYDDGEEGDEDEEFSGESESNEQIHQKQFSDNSMDDNSLNSDSDANDSDSSESDNSSDSSSTGGGRNFTNRRRKDSHISSSKPSSIKLKPKIVLSNSSCSNSNSRSFPSIPSLDSSYDTHLQAHANINSNNPGYKLNVNDLFSSPWDETYVKPKINIKKKRQILDEDSDEDFEDSDDSYDCQEDEKAEKALQKQDRLLCNTPSKKLNNKKTVTFSSDLISTNKPPPKKRGRKPKIRYDDNGNPIPRPEESLIPSSSSSNNTQIGLSRHTYDAEHPQKRSRGSRRGYKHLTKEEIDLIKRSSRKDVALLSKRLRLSYQTLRKIFIRLEEEGEFD